MNVIIQDSAGKPLSGSFYKVDEFRNPIDKKINFSNGMAFIDSSNGADLYLFESPGYSSFVSDVAGLNMDNTIILLKNENSNLLLALSGGAIILLLTKNEKNRKKAVMAKIDADKIMPFVWVGGGLIALSAIKKILTVFGVVDSQDTTDLNQQATNPGSFWNPTYWRQFNNFSYVIDYNTAANLVDKITSSFGAFNDNEEQAIGVFKQLRTKANLSYLADVFYQIEGEDLLTYLRGGIWPQDRLSDSDVNAINSFIQKLPTN